MKPTSHPLIVFLALMAVALFVTAGVLVATSPKRQILTSAPAITGKTVTSGTASIGGPFTLASTRGDNVADQSFPGKWRLLFFGYTFCPDACPTALSNISVALEKLGADADKLQPLFVTVDPQRDTRDVMAEYLKSFDSRILGLTGTKDQIDNVIKEFHLYVSRDKPDNDGSYLVSHSSYIYLMDRQGTFVDVIQGAADGDAIAAWLRKEMANSSS
jgi:cytochrome oxidase Cu insertion factor (SCO1/SenC/PrrC family)